MNPYTGLIVEATELVRPGGNLIQVHVDSRMKPNSRWYVGTGLYRRVWLHLAEPVSAAPEGLRVTTKAVEGEEAVIELSAALTGPAFYEACDKLGMLVIEEAFDEWVMGPTDFGLHITFQRLVERPQERRNILRPDDKLPDFMLHILHTVGVKHSHIDHAGLEELCHTLCQQDPHRIEVDRIEVAQLRLAQTGVDVPVPVAEFLDKISL